MSCTRDMSELKWTPKVLWSDSKTHNQTKKALPNKLCEFLVYSAQLRSSTFVRARVHGVKGEGRKEEKNILNNIKWATRK